MAIEMSHDSLVRGRLKLGARWDAAEIPRFEDERPTDQGRMAERQLRRDDPSRAAAEHDGWSDPDLPEQPCRVVGVLGRASTRPILAAAAERPPAVVGHDGVSRQALRYGSPALGILGPTGDQQDRRSVTPDLGVDGRPVDPIAARPRRRCTIEGIGVGHRVRLGSHQRLWPRATHCCRPGAMRRRGHGWPDQWVEGIDRRRRA